MTFLKLLKAIELERHQLDPMLLWASCTTLCWWVAGKIFQRSKGLEIGWFSPYKKAVTLIITAPFNQHKPDQSNIQSMWPGDCGMLGQGALKPQLFDYKPQYDLKGALQNRFLLGFNTQDTSEARLETLKLEQFERERDTIILLKHMCVSFGCSQRSNLSTYVGAPLEHWGFSLFFLAELNDLRCSHHEQW